MCFQIKKKNQKISIKRRHFNIIFHIYKKRQILFYFYNTLIMLLLQAARAVEINYSGNQFYQKSKQGEKQKKEGYFNNKYYFLLYKVKIYYKS